MNHNAQNYSGEKPSQKIRQVTDQKTGEQLQIVYAIPPALIEGAGGLDEKGVGLADLVQRLWHGKWLIMAGGLLGMAIGVINALSLPNVFTAEVTALPPSNESGTAGIAQYAGLAAMAGVQLPTGPASSVDEIMAILSSRRLAEPLIERFELAKYYFENPEAIPREDLLDAFSNDFSAKHSAKNNQIIFGYTHEKPTVALAVTQAAAEGLKTVFNQIHQSEARRELAFLGDRLEQAHRDQQSAMESMAVFQRETGAVEIEAQTKATIEAIASLQGELIAQQVELRALLASQVSEGNPRIQLLQERIAAASEQMRSLLGTERVEDGVLVALGTAPELSVQYLGLLREVRKQEAILNAVTTQHQAAEVNVARAGDAVTIVDAAVLPEKKSGPARSYIVVLSTVVGGMLGIMIVFLPCFVGLLREKDVVG